MGAQQHRDKRHILIFSVYQPNRAEYENLDNHQTIVMYLKQQNVPFKVLLGAYNNVTEQSILVLVKDRVLVEQFCKQFNQRCYLESHNDRSTELVYPSGRRVSVGILQAMSEIEAKNLGFYSYCPINKVYYATI